MCQYLASVSPQSQPLSNAILNRLFLRKGFSSSFIFAQKFLLPFPLPGESGLPSTSLHHLIHQYIKIYSYRIFTFFVSLTFFRKRETENFQIGCCGKLLGYRIKIVRNPNFITVSVSRQFLFSSSQFYSSA